MRIAIPITEGPMPVHFNQSSGFALIDVDPEQKQITGRRVAGAPENEPGLLPSWLAENGVDLVIAGGMGRPTQRIFARKGIDVVTGVTPGIPESLVAAYLNGTLRGEDDSRER